MTETAVLKERVLQAEAEASYYKGLVESFFSGIVPDRADFNHFLMAQWGRKRLAERAKTAALFRDKTN